MLYLFPWCPHSTPFYPRICARALCRAPSLLAGRWRCRWPRPCCRMEADHVDTPKKPWVYYGILVDFTYLWDGVLNIGGIGLEWIRWWSALKMTSLIIWEGGLKDLPGFADRPGKQSLVLPIAKLAGKTGSWKVSKFAVFPPSKRLVRRVRNHQHLSWWSTVEFSDLCIAFNKLEQWWQRHWEEHPLVSLPVLRKRVVPVIEETEDVPQAESWAARFSWFSLLSHCQQTFFFPACECVPRFWDWPSEKNGSGFGATSESGNGFPPL